MGVVFEASACSLNGASASYDMAARAWELAKLDTPSPPQKLDTETTKEKSHKSLWLMALQERQTGFGPATFGLGSRCSTN